MEAIKQAIHNYIGEQAKEKRIDSRLVFYTDLLIDGAINAKGGLSKETKQALDDRIADIVQIYSDVNQSAMALQKQLDEALEANEALQKQLDEALEIDLLLEKQKLSDDDENTYTRYVLHKKTDAPVATGAEVQKVLGLPKPIIISKQTNLSKAQRDNILEFVELNKKYLEIKGY